MGAGGIGFFLGVLPGLALVVRNMLRFRREVITAEALASGDGSVLDFHYSASLKSDFIFRPKVFIKADDGAGLRGAKRHLLSVRRRTLINHLRGTLVAALGALLGSFFAVGLWPQAL